MHCIASSLCFWVWTIIRETIESINVYEDAEKDRRKIPTVSFAASDDQPVAAALSSHAKIAAEELKAYLNLTTRIFTRSCEGDRGLRLIYQNFSPYLYPFSVEYSILVGELKQSGAEPIHTFCAIVQWASCLSYGAASETAKTVLERRKPHPRRNTATPRQLAIILRATLSSTPTVIRRIKDSSGES